MFSVAILPPVWGCAGHSTCVSKRRSRPQSLGSAQSRASTWRWHYRADPEIPQQLLNIARQYEVLGPDYGKPQLPQIADRPSTTNQRVPGPRIEESVRRALYLSVDGCLSLGANGPSAN